MKKIMIVDDNESFAEGLRYILEKQGYSIVTASTGQQCLDMVGVEKPDLILMDLMLPDNNGAVIVKEMLDMPDLIKCRIVFLTALVDGNESDVENEVLVENHKFPIIGKMTDIQDLFKKIKLYIS